MLDWVTGDHSLAKLTQKVLWVELHSCESSVEGLTCGICDCDLIWKHVLADVIKWRWSHTGVGWLYVNMTGCPYKKGKEKLDADRQEERPVIVETEQWCIYKPGNVKDHWKPPEVKEEARKNPSLKPSARAWPCQHLHFGLLISRTVRQWIVSSQFVILFYGSPRKLNRILNITLKDVSSVASVISDSLWPLDCSLQGSSVHGILQGCILERVAMPSSRGFSQPRNWTSISCGSCISGGFFTAEPQGKPTLKDNKFK